MKSDSDFLFQRRRGLTECTDKPPGNNGFSMQSFLDAGAFITRALPNELITRPLPNEPRDHTHSNAPNNDYCNEGVAVAKDDIIEIDQSINFEGSRYIDGEYGEYCDRNGFHEQNGCVSQPIGDQNTYTPQPIGDQNTYIPQPIGGDGGDVGDIRVNLSNT